MIFLSSVFPMAFKNRSAVVNVARLSAEHMQWAHKSEGMLKYLQGLKKPLCIRLLRRGCANRPFFHIVAVHPETHCMLDGVEQLGVYDPMPNENNERLLSLDVERFKHYVAEGAWIRSSVAMHLGAAGLIPLHPHSLTLGWRRREYFRKLEEEKNLDKKTEA